MDAKAQRVSMLVRTLERRRGRIEAGGMLFSVVYNVTIDELMYHIVKLLIKDRYKIIVDPTCGIENRQFRNTLPIMRMWGIEYRACELKPNNWACRNGFNPCRCDVFRPETLPEGDVYFYDPPYMPSAKSDKRAADYGIDAPITPDTIMKYYDERVFRGFAERGAKLVIAKGADFYYPQISDRLYLFLRDILRLPPDWRITGIIVYRYFSNMTNILGARIRKSAEKRALDLIRPVIVHTYYVIIRTPS